MSKEPKIRTDPSGNPLPPRMHHQRGHYYHVSGSRERRIWSPLGPNYVAALARWARLEGAGQGVQTVAQAVEAYLMERGDKLAPSTRRNYRNSQKRINDWAGAVFLDELDRSDVREWLHAGEHRHVSANRDLALLRAALHHAHEVGALDSNPAAGVRRLTEAPRRRVGAVDEIEALGRHASPMWCAIISFALLTGARPGDIRRLKRAQLLDKGVHITHRKTGAETLYEWTPGLRAVIQSALAAHPKRTASMWVFCNRSGQEYTADGFRTIWHKLRADAGVEGLQFRDLRRTAANYASDLDAARALLGHADTKITARVYRTHNTARPNK